MTNAKTNKALQDSPLVTLKKKKKKTENLQEKVSLESYLFHYFSSLGLMIILITLL